MTEKARLITLLDLDRISRNNTREFRSCINEFQRAHKVPTKIVQNNGLTTIYDRQLQFGVSIKNKVI